MSIGLKIFHYSNSFKSEGDHYQMTKDFGESNTDTSKWKPSIASVRSFLGSPNSSRKKFLYDFSSEEEIDDNHVRTFLRTPGLDITEIETAEKRITQVIEDLKATGEKNQKAIDQYKKSLKDLSDAINDRDSDDSDDSDDSEQSGGSE